MEWELGNADRHAEKEDHEKTEGEDSHLQAKEQPRIPGLEGNTGKGFALTALRKNSHW